MVIEIINVKNATVCCLLPAIGRGIGPMICWYNNDRELGCAAIDNGKLFVGDRNSIDSQFGYEIFDVLYMEEIGSIKKEEQTIPVYSFTSQICAAFANSKQIEKDTIGLILEVEDKNMTPNDVVVKIKDFMKEKRLKNWFLLFDESHRKAPGKTNTKLFIGDNYKSENLLHLNIPNEHTTILNCEGYILQDSSVILKGESCHHTFEGSSRSDFIYYFFKYCEGQLISTPIFLEHGMYFNPIDFNNNYKQTKIKTDKLPEIFLKQYGHLIPDEIKSLI